MAASEVLFDVFVHLRTASEDLIVQGQAYIETEKIGDDRKLYLRDYIAYPDSRAYKIVFQYEETIMEIYYNTTIYLIPSTAYNHSFWVKQGDVLLLEGYTNPADRKSYYESDVIIASEISLPYYFPVETSYKVGGNITDLALMTIQISETQIGQWPIIVLTDRGIFALEQGSGTVLYSSLLPISADNCSPGAVQTRIGVVYITNSAVNLLSGRQSINLSEMIEGVPDVSLQANPSFLLACENNAELYNIIQHLSSADLREYLTSAKLFYDTTPAREEIIVSNPNYKYSYVLSLNTKYWHKLTATYTYASDKYVLIKSGSLVDVADMLTEIKSNSIITHVQSRPLKLGAEGYKTIYRAIIRGMLSPATDKAIGVYIYASNDLINWDIVSAAQAGQTLSQLRLYRTRRSYKYFVVVCGGIVNPKSHIAYLSLEVEDKYTNKDR